MTPMFTLEKFHKLVLLIADRSRDDPKFDMNKLNKLMFYTDSGCYLLLGKPVTGATYQHWPEGPIAKEMSTAKRNLVEGKLANIEHRPYFNGIQERIVPTQQETDKTLFSESELFVVNEVMDCFWHYNAKQIRDYSHLELGWRATEDFQDIPYETALLSHEPLSAEQIELSQRIAAGSE